MAVCVGWAGGGQHERALGHLAEQLRHLGEVVGHEIAAARPVRLARGRREEAGDVPQSVAELAADVRPLVKGVHLVHADAAQVLLMLL
jgi:hypothetical protein